MWCKQLWANCIPVVHLIVNQHIIVVILKLYVFVLKMSCWTKNKFSSVQFFFYWVYMFFPKILSTYLFSGENFLLTHNFGLSLLSRHVSTEFFFTLSFCKRYGKLKSFCRRFFNPISFSRRVSQKFLLTLLSAESLILLLKMVSLL